MEYLAILPWVMLSLAIIIVVSVVERNIRKKSAYGKHADFLREPFTDINALDMIGPTWEADVRSRLIPLVGGGQLFSGLVIPTGRGTAEIDHLLVTRKGLFSVECKGTRNKDALWNLYLDGGDVAFSFPYDDDDKKAGHEPIRKDVGKQNALHIKALEDLLKPKKRPYSVLAIEAKIQFLSISPVHDAMNCNGIKTFVYIDDFVKEYKKLPDVYSASEVKEFIKVLENLDSATLHSTHINEVCARNIKPVMDYFRSIREQALSAENVTFKKPEMVKAYETSKQYACLIFKNSKEYGDYVFRLIPEDRIDSQMIYSNPYVYKSQNITYIYTAPPAGEPQF